ncbi:MULTISPECIES: winged helix-turn-helix transcriptional regulator [unclassified Nocardia]|uniref:winged helix-turn-helix transcriptional regulator n=1 Tax=unclassified Nocardia TaxID=2637762 RepID=UPI002E2144CF
MTDRAEYSAENCSVARTLAVVGERWTLLVLREAYYGVRRFSDFQANLGIARNLLATRLGTLVEQGILARETYQEPGSRARQEYRLTVKGRDLFPALVALMQWGDTYLADPKGPAVEIRHDACDEPVRAVLHCAHGHGPLTARETHPVPGPGAIRVHRDPASTVRTR